MRSKTLNSGFREIFLQFLSYLWYNFKRRSSKKFSESTFLDFAAAAAELAASKSSEQFP